MNAAAKVFASRGYLGTTISGIAAEMGAPKSAVGYHHFETKEEIALAIVEQQRARWLGVVDEITRGPGTGLEQLLSILLSAAVDARNNPTAAAAARLLVEHRATGLPIPESPLRWRSVGKTLVQRSLDEGDLVTTKTAEEIVSLLFTTGFGLFTAENNGFEESDTEAHLRELWLDLLVTLNVAEPASVVARVGVTVLPREDPVESVG